MFFCFSFCCRKNALCSKKLEQTTYINKLLKNKFCKCGDSAPGLPNYSQEKSADAIEISYYSERLKMRLQTPNNHHSFKLVGERSERFASAETYYDHVIELFASGPLRFRIPHYAHAQILAMTNH